MADTTYANTIDWDRFWTDADDGKRASASPSRRHVVVLLPQFVAEKGVPETFADVGCGTSDVLFEMAERYPDLTALGYDAAEPILADNRRRAEAEGHSNVRFEHARLPDFDPAERFDLVLCHATLDYVAEAETAVQNLYDVVAPGGNLVVQYPSRLAQTHRQRVLETPEQFMEDPEDFDAEWFAERFQLVLEGENTLSYETIEDALGTWPRSFWEVVDKPDEPWAWRHFPMVWVPK